MVVDEDMVECLHQKMQEGHSSGLAAIASCTSAIDPKTAYNAQERRCCEYMAAGCLRGALGGDMSVSCDGTRVVNPAEDTVTAAVYPHPPGIGTVLPQSVTT